MTLFVAAKAKSFRWKKRYLFVSFARKRGCGYSLVSPHQGGSNGNPQSMFYSRTKKNNVYPRKSFFFFFFLYKSGVWGGQNYIDMFSWLSEKCQDDNMAKIVYNNWSHKSWECRPRWLSWMRRPTGDQEVAGSTPAEVGNILSWRLIMKIFFTVILSLPLIQEGQLSVSGERMCTILVNRLEA